MNKVVVWSIMEKLIFKVRGEKREMITIDITSTEISDYVESTGKCNLTVKQKITEKQLLRAYDVQFWYLSTLKGPSK